MKNTVIGSSESFPDIDLTILRARAAMREIDDAPQDRIDEIVKTFDKKIPDRADIFGACYDETLDI